MKTVKLILVFLLSAFFIAACAANTTTNQTANTTANNTTTTANTPANTTANTAAPNSNAAAPNTELASTKAIYDQHCVKCHKETGEGGSMTIDDIDIDVPNLKDPKIAKEPDSDYRKKIERGGDGMPKFRDKLSKEEINSLISYIRTEFQGK